MYWPLTARSARTSPRQPAPFGAISLLGIALCSVAALSACATVSKPDLRRLYQTANVATEQQPLILIPGIMGSQLRDRSTHRVVWPGSIWNLLFNHFNELALEVDPGTLTAGPGKLEAFDITNAAAGHRFYQNIVDTLVQYGGYRLTALGTPVSDPYERHLYVFPYDWRLDNVESARRLADFIDQLRRDYARPDLKADIVAHSMGGIVSRYLLNFGTEDILDRDEAPATMAGASRINRLVLLGTPSLGSTHTIKVFIEGERIVQRIKPEVLATMPSTFQLLPNEERKPLIGIDGRPLRQSAEANSPELDLFDIGTWKALQWSVFDPQVIARIGPQRAEVLQRYFAKYLQRAARLQKALRQPQPPSATRLIVFGADCTLTPARVLVENVDGRMMPRYEPQEITKPQVGPHYDEVLREPGDGLVAKASLLGRQSLDPTVHGSNDGFPIAFSFFLCSEHSEIPSNINFQDNLLNALLSR
jgi:pimeloyl-ACP methyl ester carboxylesterase